GRTPAGSCLPRTTRRCAARCSQAACRHELSSSPGTRRGTARSPSPRSRLGSGRCSRRTWSGLQTAPSSPSRRRLCASCQRAPESPSHSSRDWRPRRWPASSSLSCGKTRTTCSAGSTRGTCRAASPPSGASGWAAYDNQSIWRVCHEGEIARALLSIPHTATYTHTCNIASPCGAWRGRRHTFFHVCEHGAIQSVTYVKRRTR
ncbi:hypothetical protein EMIHUDRAFT_452044, partial [Emiliania huxleyi CCMP1516]|uniref:Uncharacterized protein n=2 Tax=Emiliania huxleyi TaxID=2903 RepID=A0A0D3IPG7_EMIH1